MSYQIRQTRPIDWVIDSITGERQITKTGELVTTISNGYYELTYLRSFSRAVDIEAEMLMMKIQEANKLGVYTAADDMFEREVLRVHELMQRDDYDGYSRVESLSGGFVATPIVTTVPFAPVWNKTTEELPPENTVVIGFFKKHVSTHNVYYNKTAGWKSEILGYGDNKPDCWSYIPVI